MDFGIDVFPLEHAPALSIGAAQALNQIDAGINLVFVIVVEIGDVAFGGVGVEIQTHFIIDAGFGFQVFVANQKAFGGVPATIACAVHDVIGIDLVNAGRFVSAGHAKFQSGLVVQFLPHIQAG